MDALIGPLRWIHIFAGALALVVAPGAMLTVKGGRAHRRWGKIHFWLMAVVGLTAVVLGLWRPVTFLILVAVFSCYAAFTGYRVLGRKRPDRGDRPARGPEPESAVVLGAIGVALAGRDLWRFTRPPHDPRHWWFHHMTGLLTSYVPAVTAFSAVNFTFLPTTVRWLWPTLIGTVGIVGWVRYYRTRFARRLLAASGS